jgi:ABC-type branched-subunit amino acid transport system ATPase component/ABC-type branched-subunit amino acid transport system permease subunit
MLAHLLPPWHIGTANTVFEGFVEGLSFALIAMGIVLVYRSSRIINFAVASLGLPAAAVLAVFVVRSDWPYWIALVFALLVGTASGTAIELTVIRRLFKAPRVIVLVATIGIAELATAVTLPLQHLYTSTQSAAGTYPTPVNSTWHIWHITITGPQLLVLIAVPPVVIFLWWLLGHTRFAVSVRASATNADLARLTGISPKLMSTYIWTIAGFLSAISVILYATQQRSTELVQVGPDTLLAGLTAALIGGMRSLPRAAIGGILIGVVREILFFNFSDPTQTGLTQFLLFLLVLVMVAYMSRVDDAGGESFSFAPRVPQVPERLREIWWVRRMPQMIAVVGLLIGLLIPFVVTKSSSHLSFETILGFAICAVSLTVLTGWAGQLSLGQMGFAGIAALTAARLTTGVTLNIGVGHNRFINGSVRPIWFLIGAACLIAAASFIGIALSRGTRRRSRAIAAAFAVGALGFGAVALRAANDPSSTLHPFPFILSMLAGAVLACVTAIAVGIGALRVKGLLLAISTMAFAIAAQDYIFPRPFFDPEGINQVTLPRGHLGPIDLTHRNRAYYWMVFAVLIIVLLVVGHLRRTGIGRAIVGVRENENNAAALTVSPTRSKLIAFALGGFVAGVGGALLGGALVNIGYTTQLFTVDDSFRLVAMAVIGGIGSLAGAVVGALWVVGLPAFWPNNSSVQLLTSSIGLLVVVMYFPGGLVQIGYWLRGSLLNWLEQRLPERPAKTITAPPVSLRRESAIPLTFNTDGSVLSTRALSVRFGGLTAVDAVDFHANAGEVVGLIGTNGAGKSTLLNAIGGFVHSDGEVMLMGRNISSLPPYMRSRDGLGRTFQAATLFPELTVRETVMLALEARRRTSFWGSLLIPMYTVPVERAKRSEASELIDYLGLGRYADRFVAELSTGTRRIVELTTVLAVAPRVICLDEPTAGVAQREAEAFGPLIKRVQAELDATLIVVEHDMPLILSISDRIYCLESGAVIAEGSPAEVRDNPQVVASYLGTDERAIQRSNA